MKNKEEDLKNKEEIKRELRETLQPEREREIGELREIVRMRNTLISLIHLF